VEIIAISAFKGKAAIRNRNEKQVDKRFTIPYFTGKNSRQLITPILKACKL
jgi:isopenicillin N synthase-like dioxygenase